MKIIINDWQKKEKVRGKWIKALAKKVLEFEDCPLSAEVGIALTDNRKIRELNKKYRKVDRVTDVLAFPMEETKLPQAEACNYQVAATLNYQVPSASGGREKENPYLLGDVVISLERAKSQAKEYKHSFEKELAILIIHGILHLLGYDHLKKPEREVMAKREKIILGKVLNP